MTIPEYPITREEMYLDAIARGSGGGGGDISVVSLTATENKKYTAPSGTAYSPVTVNVPIPTPSLIAKTVTENGTYAASDDGADGYSAVTVDVAGSGGDTYHFYTYTPASDTTINSVFNAANIPLLAQDEVLIWNIKGANKQSSGSVGFKFGLVVVQDGNVVSNSGGTKRMASVEAPDSSQPSSNWVNDGYLKIENGHYVCSQTSTFGYVGGGNTFEFVQLAYDMGWNVEA